MTKPRIERVSGDYEPNYPKDLTRDEFDELIAPDQRGRMLAAATAAGVSLGASLAAQESGDKPVPPDNRAEAVLQVLSKGMTGYTTWLEHTRFQRYRSAQGFPMVIPQIPICFGNSQNGVFDSERARKLAGELFTAYGLKPVSGHKIDEAGVEATIDVWEPALQIGTKLRGNTPKKQGMFGSAEAEPPQTDLDDRERIAVGKEGHRIHTADLSTYPLMDGDQLTPTLAYLASIVAFLNEVTGGPDFDLDKILDNDRIRCALPEPEPTAGVRHERSDDQIVLTTTAAASVTFEIDPRVWERRIAPEQRFGQPSWQKLDKSLRAGGMSMLQLTLHPSAPMTVEQNGRKALRIDAAGTNAFLPPRFDPNRKFRVTLTLEAGKQYRLPAHATILGK